MIALPTTLERYRAYESAIPVTQDPKKKDKQPETEAATPVVNGISCNSLDLKIA